MVTEIFAIGVRGSVKGKKFVAELRDGLYELHSEQLAASRNVALNSDAAKVYVASLDEAAALLETGTFHIRLFNLETGQRNKRALGGLTIVRV